MQNVAKSWLIYRMTGNDPLYLGWLGLAFSVPMVVCPLIGGIVVDRVHRIRLLYVTQSSAMALAGLLAALNWTGTLRPWHMLFATFVGAILLAFDNPARQSLIPGLVPPEHLQNALSLNSATFTGAALLGPAIGGLLLERTGPEILFLLNAVSFLAVIGALVAMRGPPPHVASRGTLRDSVFGGLAYVKRDGVVLSLLLIAALAAVCVRSYPQLLPIFADDVWNAGPRGYGALLSAGGAGALAGAVALSLRAHASQKGRVLLLSGGLLCAAIAGFALAPSVSIAVPFLVVAGAASTTFTTIVATLIQLRVPSALRGRVIGLHVITLIGLPSMGSLGLASIARFVTAHGVGTALAARWVVATGAVVFALAVSVVVRRFGREVGLRGPADPS